MIVHRVSQAGFGAVEYSPDEIRDAIYAMETAIDQYPEKIGFENEHVFVNSIYGRSMFQPAGTILTGKLHANDDLLIIARGKVTFVTENGQITYDATDRPIMTVVKANTKPFLFAHEDTWFFSAHPNPNGNTTHEQMEKELITPNKPGFKPENE